MGWGDLVQAGEVESTDNVLVSTGCPVLMLNDKGGKLHQPVPLFLEGFFINTACLGYALR